MAVSKVPSYVAFKVLVREAVLPNKARKPVNLKIYNWPLELALKLNFLITEIYFSLDFLK